MLINTGINQAGVFIPFEFVNGIVHQGLVEYVQRYEQFEILHVQTGDLLEQLRLQLCYDVLQAVFPVIRQIHEHRHTGSKFDQLFLNHLALGLVFLFGVRQLFLFLRRQLFAVTLGLLDGIGLVYNGFDIGVQATESLNTHEGIHRLFTCKQTGKRIVVNIDEQCALPAFCKERGGGTSHSDIENFSGIDLSHGTAVIRQHGQEIDEFSDLLFRIAFGHIQAAGIIGNLAERTVQRKVKDVALLFYNLMLTVVLRDLPRTLYTEGRLEIGLR